MATVIPRQILDAWAFAALGVVLVIAAVVDVRTARIPNWLTYTAAVVGMIGHTLLGGLGGLGGLDGAMGLSGAAAGLAVGFLPLGAAWLAGGIGGGDAKLMAAVGALGGWRLAVMALFYGLLAAAVMAIFVALRHRIFKRTFARVLRFLFLLTTPTRPADPATPDSPKVPFGVALCLGGAAALIEAIFRGPLASKFLLGI